uniref:thermonuclease family protein n=1 Tax=Roseovarius indicus TaxID=540747 RepID=UPI003B52413E
MVVDGDTVKMTCPAEGYVSGRILGFDTPEMKSRCPTELVMAVSATFYLRWQLWTAGKVVATPRGKDRYGRVLTLMAVDDELVGTRMVGAGLARWYDGGKRRSWCGADG